MDSNSSYIVVRLVLTLLILASCFGDENLSLNCVESEREALLALKQGLIDPFGRLSSWTGEDCCKWRGVGCNNQTGHVTKLNLTNPSEDNFIGTLGGNISPSLLHLNHLTYLGLKNNDFFGIQIPQFFGMFKNLQHLDLYSSGFSGEIPPHFGNLSSLIYLNLSWNNLRVQNLHWLFGLSSLRYLFLDSMNLFPTGLDLFRAINSLPSLQVLSLGRCRLQALPLSLPSLNFTSLVHLDMSSNSIKSRLPQWLFNLTSLEYLSLRSNHFYGPLPMSLGGLCNLQELYLQTNYFSGGIDEFMSGLSRCPNNSLETLNLGGCGLAGKLPESIGALQNLQDLHLSTNSFWGSIPASIGNLSSLRYLDLSDNRMNGTFPPSFGQLSNLVTAYLPSNLWEGVLTETHLANLTSLESLAVTTLPNKSMIFDVTYDWVPPFRLKEIHLVNCFVGPAFPVWLQVQSELRYVIIRNAGISDTIAEEWFSMLLPQVNTMVLAENNIKAKLPRKIVSTALYEIDLSSNQFEGPIPLWSSNASKVYLQRNVFTGPLPENMGDLMPMLEELFVYENRLSGEVPTSICKMEDLKALSLRGNKLKGKLPRCWQRLQSLRSLDLSNNSLSGRIPTSVGLLSSLNILILSRNDLHGPIPATLKNCLQLMNVDLGWNKLSGTLPSWIGRRVSNLFILNLRSNMLEGTIPQRLCNLSNLHILDLSNNHFSGSVPRCLNKLAGFVNGNSSLHYLSYFMTHEIYYEEQTMVVTRGTELVYTTNLVYVNAIDLSRNQLTGEIPEEVSSLSSLNILNLSMNHLRGSIPDQIGDLRLLEVLDLSQNQLSGPIPQSLASLTFLNHLNLSYNNLRGRIPSGNQLQTLNESSIYEGNPLLCGVPLETKCPGDDGGTQGDSTRSGDDESILDKIPFYVSPVIGFIVGFWGVCGTLLVKKSWRYAYFRFFDNMQEKLSLIIALNLARLQRKFGWGNN